MTATTEPSSGTPPPAPQPTPPPAVAIAPAEPPVVPSGREQGQREELLKKVAPTFSKLASDKLLNQESVSFLTDKVRSDVTDRTKLMCQISEVEVRRFDTAVRAIASLPQAKDFTESDIQLGIHRALKQAGVWSVIKAVEDKSFFEKFCKKEEPRSTPQGSTQPGREGQTPESEGPQGRNAPQGGSQPQSVASRDPKVVRLIEELRIPQSVITAKNIPPVAEAKPEQLVDSGARDSGGIIKLDRQTAQAFSRMQQEAKRQGVRLTILSGFRSIDDQAGIIRRKMGEGQTPEQIFRTSAVPGYSEHHSGKAIDVGSTSDSSTHLQTSFANTKEGKWLQANAGRFGFTLSYGDTDPNKNPGKYSFEPWHIMYTGQRS